MQLRHPPFVACERLPGTGIGADREFTRIAPAGGLAHQGVRNGCSGGGEPGDGVGRSQRAVVEEMFVGAVSELSPELGPGAKLRIDARGRVDVVHTGAVAAHVAVQRDFLVPGEELPFGGRQAIGGVGAAVRGVPVMVRPVLGFDVDVEQEVVDEIVEVHELRDRLVGGFAGDARIEDGHERVPVVLVAIGDQGVVRRIIVADEHVPVGLPATEMFRHER